MEERQEVLSGLIYDKTHRIKIKEEFGFDLPLNEKADLIYPALVKERQLYFYYALSISALTQALWDFNSSTKEVIHLIREWEQCTLERTNYHSFIQVVEAFIGNDLNEEMKKKPNENFSLLLHDPKKLNNIVRDEMLLFLCRVNAFHSLRFVLKLHRGAININLSGLLREAIGCLHSECVQTLVEEGADIREYFYTSIYQDDGVHLFMPPLYYAIWAPLDIRCALNRDGPRIFWDNPKLKKIAETLVSLGADPEQNCLVAPWSSITNKKETTVNSIFFAQKLVSGPAEDSEKLNEASLSFLNYIIKLKPEADLNAVLEPEPSLRPKGI